MEKKLDEMTRLAFELADEAALSDIECHCDRTQAGPHLWYETNTADGDDAAWVARAVRYLLMRGQIMRDPFHPTRVRFLPLTTNPEPRTRGARP